MSIRRKTCETMTLLYTVALKTKPNSGDHTARDIKPPNSHSSNIDAARLAVGKVVWVKDEGRDGGGVWIAATEEDRNEAGVPGDCCLLESELEIGSEIHRQFIAAKAEHQGSHLVPRETEADVVDPSPTVRSGAAHQFGEKLQSTMQTYPGQSAIHDVNADLAEPTTIDNVIDGLESFDPGMLDQLPLSALDFNSWEVSMVGLIKREPCADGQNYFQSLNGGAGIDGGFGGMWTQ